MNTRQQKILTSVIEEYTNSAIPVSSEILVKKYQIKASTATIRNDMVKLEQDGYLYQPHISAGRIPTDKGYRYFVEEIMKEKELSKEEQKRMQQELLKLKAKNTRLTKTTAKLLSSFSGNLAIAGALDKEEFSEFGIKELLEQPEFKELDEVCKVAEVLDYIDEKIEEVMLVLQKNETKIFIGKENPIEKMPNCAMIVSPYQNKKGEKGILALIGPKRMKYAKNKSLIEYMKKLLSSSAVIIIAGNLFVVLQ